MRSCLSAAAALLMMGGLVSATRADTPLPDRWRKTMTSDPETNYFLRKYSESLPDQMETVVRSTMLFRLLSVGCRGVSFDNSVMDAYVKNSGFFALPIETAKEASRLGAALFDYFDYEALAHLCAGSDYLFGPKGVLLKNAMSKGSGELAIRYEPKNLYLKVRPILPD